jgi:hypothetical protein
MRKGEIPNSTLITSREQSKQPTSIEKQKFSEKKPEIFNPSLSIPSNQIENKVFIFYN